MTVRIVTPGCATRALQVTGLDAVLDLYPSRDAAVAPSSPDPLSSDPLPPAG